MAGVRTLAIEVCRDLVGHGYCPNCGCDLWNTSGCPTCKTMRKAHGVLFLLGEVERRDFAPFMPADEINKQNMANKQVLVFQGEEHELKPQEASEK